MKPAEPADTRYGTDFYLWSFEQAEALRAMARGGSNAGVDWENVAEEIESLGKSDRRGVESHLRRILVHLMKLEASPSSEPRAGWVETILNARGDVGSILDDSPSLRRLVPELIAREIPRARELVVHALANYGEQPRTPLDRLAYTEDQVLGNWLP